MHVCCFSCAKISPSMENMLFLKVSKFKIISGGFCCFHFIHTYYIFIVDNFMWAYYYYYYYYYYFEEIQ